MMKITERAKNMTQDRAIQFWNERNLPMVSMADTWKLQKQNNEESISELRKDWKGFNWQITSTRIIYEVSSLKGKVIHNFGSTVTKQIEIKLDEIPVCQPIYLDKLLESKLGLNYIRALINDKKATKKQIIEGFANLSGKKANKIRFWTPTQEERLNRPFRAVRLYFNDDRFNVNGNDWIDNNNGLSRGMTLAIAHLKDNENLQKLIPRTLFRGKHRVSIQESKKEKITKALCHRI